MGWTVEEVSDSEHEGWAAPALSDGRLSGGSTLGAVLVGDEQVPESQVVAFQAACVCGWRGVSWLRVSDPSSTNLRLRRVHTATGFNDDLPDSVEAMMRDEWLAHVRPVAVVGPVAVASLEYDQAGQRLTEAVVLARDAGASWADIGRAAGVSRQSAHERWAAAHERWAAAAAPGRPTGRALAELVEQNCGADTEQLARAAGVADVEGFTDWLTRNARSAGVGQAPDGTWWTVQARPELRELLLGTGRTTLSSGPSSS